MAPPTTPSVVSISEAASRGISSLVDEAAEAEEVLISRHGKPAAFILSPERHRFVVELRENLLDGLVALSRLETDTGSRTGLSDVISALGFDEAELRAELAAEAGA